MNPSRYSLSANYITQHKKCIFPRAIFAAQLFLHITPFLICDKISLKLFLKVDVRCPV